MDRKHIFIKQSRNSGAYFFNYKGSLSIVLLVLVDVLVIYSFIYVDVGGNGTISNSGTFKNSSFARAIGRNMLNVPPDQVIVEVMDPLPYLIVTDDDFPLRKDLMKPYPFGNLSHEKKVFIYRHSREKRAMENVFGIMANRFRIFLSLEEISPENIDKVTL